MDGTDLLVLRVISVPFIYYYPFISISKHIPSSYVYTWNVSQIYFSSPLLVPATLIPCLNYYSCFLTGFPVVKSSWIHLSVVSVSMLSSGSNQKTRKWACPLGSTLTRNVKSRGGPEWCHAVAQRCQQCSGFRLAFLCAFLCGSAAPKWSKYDCSSLGLTSTLSHL